MYPATLAAAMRRRHLVSTDLPPCRLPPCRRYPTRLHAGRRVYTAKTRFLSTPVQTETIHLCPHNLPPRNITIPLSPVCLESYPSRTFQTMCSLDTLCASPRDATVRRRPSRRGRRLASTGPCLGRYRLHRTRFPKAGRVVTCLPSVDALADHCLANAKRASSRTRSSTRSSTARTTCAMRHEAARPTSTLAVNPDLVALLRGFTSRVSQMVASQVDTGYPP
jgi:hypothetical protein